LEWAGCGGVHRRADSATFNFLRPTGSDRFFINDWFMFSSVSQTEELRRNGN
jgi:hypothetical protein